MKISTNIGANFLLSLALKTFGIILLFFGFYIKSFAGSGLYDAYAILNIKGAGNSSRQYSAFDSWSIGSFNNTETLVLNGAQNKTFKNGISNVTGGQLAYRVYRTGTTAPSFSFINLPFFSNDGVGGDQTWQAAAANVNLLSGLESGVYTLEVYWQAYTSDGDSYYNNSGNNYKATFTYGYVTNADGPWSTTGTWIGNVVPPIGADVIINHIVNVSDTRDVRSIFINTAKSLVVDASQILTMTGGIRGTGTMTVNGTLQLNAGYTVNLTPVYGASSKLIYNSGGTPAIGSEWTVGSGTIGSTAGYPQAIDIQNSTTLTLNTITTDRGLAGNLTLGTGTISNGSLTMGGTANKLTVNGNLVIGGNTTSGSSALTLSSNSSSASIEIGGNWTRSSTGVFNPTGRGVIFIGSGNSTISTNTSDDFPYLIANKTSGSVLLNNAITVSNTLTINGSSTFSLNGNSLTVPNLAGSSTTANINNGHATTNVTLTVNNSGTNTFAGLITNGAAATLALTKSGAGNLTMSGANSYTGTTTLSGGGGKLFLTNNMSLGALNMLASSSLDLGSGATGFTINFANSNAQLWTGTLTIFNWTPSAAKIINVAGVAPAGLTSIQLGQINFDNYGIGSKFIGIEVRPAFLYVTNGTGGGSFNAASNTSWLLADKPGVNDGTESIYVQPGDNLTLDVANPYIFKFLRVEVGLGGTLTMGNHILTVSTAGDFRIAGTVVMTASSNINMSAGINMIAQSSSASFSPAGTLNFQGAFTITSASPNAILLPNVNLNNSVDFGQNSTIQNGSSLNMNAGGFVSVNAPFYAVGSTLKFNTGGTYGRNLEWSATTGKGYPANVQISNNTTLNMGASSGAGTARQCSGSLTIDAGSTFSMAETGEAMTAAVTVNGDVNVNGTLKLSTSSGGDLSIGGNYTFAASGTVVNNGRAVTFLGALGDQVVTRTGGGIVDFDFLIINKSVGNVKMSPTTNGRIISYVNNNTAIRVLQLLSGDFDMNGGTFTIQGDNPNSMNVLVSGSTRKIFTSTGTGNFSIQGSNTPGVSKFTVISQSSGTLLFDNNVTVSTIVGVNFGASGITTINAILRIDQNGYVIANAPDYGSSSTLIYNNGPGGYLRNMEWNTNTAGTTGAGYPNNVIVQNTTPVDLNSATFPASFPLGCSGKMRIAAGSSVITGAMAYPLSVGDTLAIDGTLTLSTDPLGDLNVGGGWIRTGTGVFVQNDRMVTFDSTNTTSITATGGQIFSRMTLNKKVNNSIVTIDADVTITNELFLQRGAVTLNNDVTIKSDNTRTARIGQTTTPSNVSITYGTGKFVIQRYLPIALSSAARRWRLLTTPIKSNNAPTISAAWQEGQISNDRTAPVSTTINGIDFGTAITRSTTAGLFPGYDQGSTDNPSIFTYNAAGNNWAAIAATNGAGTKITDNQGYMIFVRGDRSILIAGTNVAGKPTTLRAKGEINIGDVTSSLSPSGFQILGNPYASAISFNNVDYSGVNPGTTAGRTFYLWDPKLSGAKNVGGWVSCTSLGNGTYTVTANSSGYSNTGIIESGAAIMVPAAGGTFTFKESCKLSTNSTVGIASRPGVTNNHHKKMDFFTANLFAGKETDAKLIDGVVNAGGDDFDNEINDKDAAKLFTFNNNLEKISILRNGAKLSIEMRKRIDRNDTIFYQLAGLKKASYQLQFIGNNINPFLVAILQDKYTGKARLMKVNDTTDVVFDVTDDKASSAVDRFRVVFKKSVKYNIVKAALLNADVTVGWNLDNELNIEQYEIERSPDGILFTKIGNLPSKGNSFDGVKYDWLDIAPTPGEYFYRIKGISKIAPIAYSETVKVMVTKNSLVMYIFPNPVTGNTLHLQMSKMPEGIYSVRVINAEGKIMMHKQINHAAGVTTETINLSNEIAKGSYQVEITGTKGIQYNLKASIQ